MTKKEQGGSTSGGTTPEGVKANKPQRERGAWSAKRSARKSVGKRGVPGSKNDSRRCTATVKSTGERCKRAAIKGGTVCTNHGGNLPQVRKKATERLQELVDPFITELRSIALDPETDPAVKVRAIIAVLDRTGHGPGMTVSLKPTEWETAHEDVVTDRRGLDVSGLAALNSPGVGEPDPIGHEDVEQAVLSAQQEADRARHDEETGTYLAGRIYPDENTVRGEVVEEAPPSYGLDPRTRG